MPVTNLGGKVCALRADLKLFRFLEERLDGFSFLIFLKFLLKILRLSRSSQGIRSVRD